MICPQQPHDGSDGFDMQHETLPQPNVAQVWVQGQPRSRSLPPSGTVNPPVSYALDRGAKCGAICAACNGNDDTKPELGRAKLPLMADLPRRWRCPCWGLLLINACVRHTVQSHRRGRLEHSD